jgi:hypothetical protein
MTSLQHPRVGKNGRSKSASHRGGLSLRTRDAVGSPRSSPATTAARTDKYWSGVAARYRRISGDDPDESLYRLAVQRLANGDVTATQYGIRVALRPDLGDDRVDAGAYWLGRDRRCLCWSQKSRKRCSHALAARIFRFENGADDR